MMAPCIVGMTAWPLLARTTFPLPGPQPFLLLWLPLLSGKVTVEQIIEFRQKHGTRAPASLFGEKAGVLHMSLMVCASIVLRFFDSCDFGRVRSSA